MTEENRDRLVREGKLKPSPKAPEKPQESTPESPAETTTEKVDYSEEDHVRLYTIVVASEQIAQMAGDLTASEETDPIYAMATLLESYVRAFHQEMEDRFANSIMKDRRKR